MFIWMIVLLSIVCADNGLGGGLSGKVGWCVTTGDLLKVKMFEEGQIRMIFCFLRPIFLIFGLKSIYRGSLAIEPHSSCQGESRVRSQDMNTGPLSVLKNGKNSV